MTVDVKNFFDGKIKLVSIKKHQDLRGFFSEVYNKKFFESLGIFDTFVQDNNSLSYKYGVIRGLHFQSPPNEQVKIIRVNRGKILDVVVDIRKNSNTYGKFLSFVLSSKNWKQLYISTGFLHGFCTLEDNTEVNYKVSNYYSPKSERTIIWNDENILIDWKIDLRKVIITKKDLNGLKFKDFISPF